MDDAALAAHVGSCVTCFRTLAELRDAPRVAAALRADAPAVARSSDRFWDDLAARTTNAAAAAMAERRAAPRRGVVDGVRRRRRGGGRAAGCWSRACADRAVVAPAAAPVAAARTAAGVDDEATDDEAVDVSDLDESALRRLLDRLRARAPRERQRAGRGGRCQETTDVAFDDDGQLNDELAELDGAALLRVERSLAGASL